MAAIRPARAPVPHRIGPTPGWVYAGLGPHRIGFKLGPDARTADGPSPSVAPAPALRPRRGRPWLVAVGAGAGRRTATNPRFTGNSPRPRQGANERAPALKGQSLCDHPNTPVGFMVELRGQGPDLRVLAVCATPAGVGSILPVFRGAALRSDPRLLAGMPPACGHPTPPHPSACGRKQTATPTGKREAQNRHTLQHAGRTEPPSRPRLTRRHCAPGGGDRG